METCCSNEGRKETVETKPVCCQGSDSGSQTQDIGTAGQSLEPTEVSSVPLEQQPPGKQKKTPFKFFGVRKSICTLPNFFSGRNKGPGKGALKKGLCKSKTHDCISDVTYGEVKRGPLGNISNGATILNQQENHASKTLPTSQSAHMAIEASHKLDFNHPRASLWGSTGGLDTKQKEDKLSSFPKAKKGFKGLFSGMRRHKKSKALNSDKVEPHELTVLLASEDQVNKKPRTEPAVPQGCNDPCPVGNDVTAVYIESPSKKKGLGKIKKNTESDIADKISDGSVVSERHSETWHVAVNMTENDIHDVKLDEVTVCENSDYSSIPGIVNQDHTDNEPPSAHSADQISLIFDDVSSLKSFDSLTGCGDIIADQDIDSIAESTISVERSRELGKRSSCLVSYQGGGEEMATPDELGEEYLGQLWENAAEGDASCEMKASQSEGSHGELHELVPPALQMDITHLCADGAAVDNVDLLLTPQSDQQGSAPNSDEGYYDSTTPGPDDEAGDSLSCDFKKDSLPRDSYSGDALYEFYEPDDSLMSPPTGGTSLFENDAYCPEIFDHFLDGSLPNDMNVMEIIGQEMGAMETEEDRLAAIQKQILHWERKSQPVLINTELVSQEKCSKENQNVECKNRTVSIGRKQSCLDSEQVASRTSSRTSINSTFTVSGTEHPNWRDLPGISMPCSSTFFNGTCDLRTVGNRHVTKNSSTFDSDVDSSVFGTIGCSGSGTYPNIRKVHHGSCLASEPNDCVSDTNSSNMSEHECEQAVSFSQALVDFTSNGTLFSSLSESLGSSDSGSSFTQNLTTLPTMVNFDIVDVENDGEGEFDQQIEMSAEEELNASFEDFESSYVQKESFAECDERMFNMDPQSALHNCNWGVASLPRHLSLYKLGSSVPAPLSLNRRSRSLDTENLEFELANLHLSKSGLRSCELPQKWEDKKDVLFYERCISKGRAQPFYSDGREVADDSNWLRPLRYDAGLSPDTEERWDLVQNVGATVLGSDLHTSVPCEIDTQGRDRKVFERRPENRGAGNPSPRQMVRPSNLLLQSSGRQSPEVSSSYPYYAEHMKKNLAIALPSEEQKGFPPRFCFPQSSQNQTKCKPIGITHGMPQFNPNGTETLKHSANYAERFESPHKGMQKGRIEQVKTMPASWSNNYTECHSNQMVSFSFGGGAGV